MPITEIKISDLWVLTDGEGTVYPKIFVDEDEAIECMKSIGYNKCQRAFINESPN
jgi:hypothetical protein